MSMCLVMDILCLSIESHHNHLFEVQSLHAMLVHTKIQWSKPDYGDEQLNQGWVTILCVVFQTVQTTCTG